MVLFRLSQTTISSNMKFLTLNPRPLPPPILLPSPCKRHLCVETRASRGPGKEGKNILWIHPGDFPDGFGGAVTIRPSRSHLDEDVRTVLHGTHRCCLSFSFLPVSESSSLSIYDDECVVLKIDFVVRWRAQNPGDECHWPGRKVGIFKSWGKTLNWTSLEAPIRNFYIV